MQTCKLETELYYLFKTPKLWVILSQGHFSNLPIQLVVLSCLASLFPLGQPSVTHFPLSFEAEPCHSNPSVEE